MSACLYLLFFGITLLTSCGRHERTGSAVGAATGAIIGSSVSSRKDSTAGAIIGGLVGNVIGGSLGRAADEEEEVLEQEHQERRRRRKEALERQKIRKIKVENHILKQRSCNRRGKRAYVIAEVEYCSACGRPTLYERYCQRCLARLRR